MSYNKLGFTSGQTLKAEHLNHMEEGIANASGVSSWNDLTDKPFYDETLEPITWDGNTEGLVEVGYSSNESFFKISDKVFTYDDVINASYIFESDDAVYYFTAEVLEENGCSPDSDVLFDGNIAFVRKAGASCSLYGSSFTFPEVGVYGYAATDSTYYLKSITFRSQVKQLDSKFVPSMRINVYCDDESSGMCYADKTLEEIAGAIDNGILPYCVLVYPYNVVLYINKLDYEYGIIFGGVYANDVAPEIHGIVFNTDGSIYYHRNTLAIDIPR